MVRLHVPGMRVCLGMVRFVKTIDYMVQLTEDQFVYMFTSFVSCVDINAMAFCAVGIAKKQLSSKFPAIFLWTHFSLYLEYYCCYKRKTQHNRLKPENDKIDTMPPCITSKTE